MNDGLSECGWNDGGPRGGDRKNCNKEAFGAGDPTQEDGQYE